MTGADYPTFLISAGGTGGGIYPALAVIEALQRITPGCKVHYVGSVGGMEYYLVPRDLVTSYQEVRSGPVHGVGVRRTVSSLLKISAGVLQSWQIIARLKPALLFMTGGWATLPVAFACWLRHIPIVIFLPDIEPALTIKFTSRLAHTVLTATADSAAYFPRRTRLIEVGYPLRAAVMKANRSEGLTHFQLDPTRKTLLVSGGSRGAQSINQALTPIAPDLVADGWQLIHITGQLDWPMVEPRREALPEAIKTHYHAFPYLYDDMGLALAAADLAVSRSGASTLGELPFFGLPSILVPYPFAWRYQKVNADWLVSRGAAIRLNDEALNTELLPTIRTFSGEAGQTHLAAMHQSAAALARPDVAGRIAQDLLTLAANPL